MTLKKQTNLYFDTSILLALVDDPTRNQEKEINFNKTHELWKLIQNNPDDYKTYISTIGDKEVSDTLTKNNRKHDYNNQNSLQNKINHTIINPDSEKETLEKIEFLFKKYTDKENGILTKQQDKDAYHIAIATVIPFPIVFAINYQRNIL
jgi:hypothetical protein